MRYYFLVLISTLMLSGCGLVYDQVRDCPSPVMEPSDDILLSFQMISANIGTRADDFTGHEETNSDWPQFEDLIDVEDFAFYIFLDNATDKPLVMKMSDIANSTDPNQMITGAYGAYTVTTVIPKHNLEDLLGHELNPNTTNSVDFRIVLLANFNSGERTDKVDYNLLAPSDAVSSGGDLTKVTTFDQFMTNANGVVYNLNDLYSPISGDSQVSGLYKGAIPMFGMRTFSTSEDQLFLSRPEERIYMGDIYMLRSLAKIRVIDNSEKDDNGYPYISLVYIESVTNMLSPLPANAAEYLNDSQVHTMKYVSRSGQDNQLSFGLGTLGQTQNQKGTTRFGYLPEQEINYGLPKIHIRAQLDAERSEEYAIPMQGDQENFPTFNGFAGSILRNHIYTLSVNNIAVGTPAEITVNVANWQTPNEGDYNLDFTNTLLFPNKLNWISGVYNSGTYRDTGNVVATPWVTNSDNTQSPVPLVCEFGFQSPIGATWQAYFVGDASAFKFVDENGATVGETMTEGTINNKMSTLRIVTTDPNPSRQYAAKLQIVVLMPDGSVIEAHSSDSESYENFTLIQESI